MSSSPRTRPIRSSLVYGLLGLLIALSSTAAAAAGATAEAGATPRETLERALLHAEAGTDWRARVEAHARYGEFLQDANEAGAALAAFRRAGAILTRNRTRLASGAQLELARPIRTRLADLLLRAASRADGDEPRQQSLLREAIDALEELKTSELRDYFGDACLANLTRTTPERLPDTLLLYPIVLADRVELVLGRQGRLVRLRAPIEPDALREAARRFRRALQDPTTPRYRKTGARLYEALIRPIARDGFVADTTLTFVPSGALRTIPAAAFYDARANAFLVEQVAVATLPSLRIVAPREIDPRRARLLAAGLGPARPLDARSDAASDPAPLPAVAREIAAVTRHFSGVTRLGDAFSRDALARALDREPFDMIHLATHARFDAEAAESHLLTSDGRLRLSEFADMIATTRHRTSRPLELLTLSACETAVGDERASLGLAGVAVQSGARSAIASLWRVNDAATADLFAIFYEQLARPGSSRARALQHAQQALIESRTRRHPIFWSAFLLINSWY